MSRVLGRALRPGDGPAPVRPRLPALFEPGLDLVRAAAGPEQLPAPELAEEKDHQDNQQLQNGSWLSPAGPDLAGGGAPGAEPGIPGTSATAGYRPAAGSARASAQGGVPDRARRSTRMPGYPIRPANGTDAGDYPFAGPAAPGAAAGGSAAWPSPTADAESASAAPSAPSAGAGGRASSSFWRSPQRLDRPAADAAGGPSAGPLAPGAGEVTPAGAASAWWPAPGRWLAAAPRLHRDARQHGASQHGAGGEGVGQHSVDPGSVDPGSPGQGGVALGRVRPAAAEPVVRISIGRVEIRADRADAPRPPRPASRPRPPALDLAEYLRRRGGQR